MALNNNDQLLIFKSGLLEGENANRRLTYGALKTDLGIDKAYQAFHPETGTFPGIGKVGFVTPGPNIIYDRETGVFDIDISSDISLVDFINFNNTPPGVNGDPDDPDTWPVDRPTATPDKPADNLLVGSYYVVQTPCTTTSVNWGISGTNFEVDNEGSGYHVTNGEVSFTSLVNINDVNLPIVPIPETIASVINGGLAQLASFSCDPAAYPDLFTYSDGDTFTLDFSNSLSHPYANDLPPIVEIHFEIDDNNPSEVIVSFDVIRSGKLTIGTGLPDEEYFEKLNLFTTETPAKRTNIYVDVVIKNGKIERITDHTGVNYNNLSTSYLIAGVSGDIDNYEDKITESTLSIIVDSEFTKLNVNDKLMLTRNGWKHVVDVTAGNYIYDVKHDLDNNGQIKTLSLNIDTRQEGASNLKRTYLSIDTVTDTVDGLMPHDMYEELKDLPTNFSKVNDIIANQEISPDLLIHDSSYVFDPENEAYRFNVEILSAPFEPPNDYIIGILPTTYIPETDANIGDERLRGTVFVAKEEELINHDDLTSTLYYSCVPNMELMENHYRPLSKIDYVSTQCLTSVLLTTQSGEDLINVVKDRTEIGKYTAHFDINASHATSHTFQYKVEFEGNVLDANPIDINNPSVDIVIEFKDTEFDGNAGTIKYLTVTAEALDDNNNVINEFTVQDQLAIYFHS